MVVLGVLSVLVVAVGASSGYWGSDNRVVPAVSRGSEQSYHPWPPPGIEYHYPDTQSNQIPAQPPPARARVPLARSEVIMSRPRRPQHRHTAGLYHSTQWGSARIPHRGATVTVPVSGGRRKAYRGTVTTTVLDAVPGRQETRAKEPQPPRDQPPPAPPPCVRCPGDRAVVAGRGSDFVLLEQPALKSCGVRSQVHDVDMETIFGPQPGSPVPEGSHVIVARVLHEGKSLQVCQYRYNVVVRRCPPLVLPPHAGARCSASNVWGSECWLSCHPGYRLQGHNTTSCEDKGRWGRPLPRCVPERDCIPPSAPPHGRLSCQTATGGHPDLLPEGTVCHRVCDEGYSLPPRLGHLATVSCSKGRWNTTAEPACREPRASRKGGPDGGPAVRLRHRGHGARSSRTDVCRPNPCQGGGTCLRGPRAKPLLCVCPEDREGEQCERARCGANACHNGGHCFVLGDSAVCYCPAGFTGQHCETQDAR